MKINWTKTFKSQGVGLFSACMILLGSSCVFEEPTFPVPFEEESWNPGPGGFISIATHEDSVLWSSGWQENTLINVWIEKSHYQPHPLTSK